MVCVGLTWGDGADSAGETGGGANCAVTSLSDIGRKAATGSEQSTLLLCPGEEEKSGTWGVVRRVPASS